MYTIVNYHFVWSVKYRRKVLTGDVAETLSNLPGLNRSRQGVHLEHSRSHARSRPPLYHCPS
ncbi:MAG: hypothetical protein GX882_06310 [Methanomicrobiales archaeon]|nr:hypothetical protein [Methanomicrobiales archaeon]